MKGKIIAFLVIIGVLFYLVYAYEHTITCSLLNQISPQVANIFECGQSISQTSHTGNTVTINNITGYETNVFQNLTYKFNNASYGVNYTKQYELAKKANPNITNVVPF
ncbi:MAG: hypothetical protein ACP5TL_03030, partial [Candidatus Micrarchaeia archaeon]